MGPRERTFIGQFPRFSPAAPVGYYWRGDKNLVHGFIKRDVEDVDSDIYQST